MKKKYVVLEHLLLPDRGKRYWTMNTDNNCCLYGDRITCKEVYFTDDKEEAIKVSGEWNTDTLPTFDELIDYYSIIDSEDIV